MSTSLIKKTIRRSVATCQRLVLITAALALGAGNARADRPEGIDSDFRAGSINWTTVAGDGIQFACIKATQLDAGFSNSVFAACMSGAQAAGIYTIPYNRCNPTMYEPKTEAKFFWSFAGASMAAGGFNLSPALDVEDGLGGPFKDDSGASVSLSVWCNDWYADVAAYAAAAGITLQQITYVNAGSSCDLSASIGGSGWIAWTNCAYPYGSGLEQTGTPWCEGTGCEVWGSGKWSIWQWAWPGEGQGILPGLPEHVDQNVFNGTLTQMVSDLETSSAFGEVAFKPCTILDGGGNEKVFALQYTGYAPWHAHNSGPGTTWTEGWLGNGGQFQGSSAIVPVLNANGYMEIFGVGVSGADLMHANNTGAETNWGAWSILGSSGYTGNPTAIEDPANGRVEVYVHNTAGGSVQRFYHTGFSGAWSNESLGGALGSDPTAIINANGYYNVFAVDTSGNLVDRWNTGPGTAWNSGGWTTIGTGCAGRPAVAVRSDGGVEIFVRRASDNTVNHYYHGGFTNAWGSANLGEAMASNLSAVEVENAGTNHQLEVFGITSSGGLWCDKNSGPGTSWGAWTQITTGSTLISDPCALVNTNGALEVFARVTPSMQMGHVANTGPGTAWGAFGLFNGPQ